MVKSSDLDFNIELDIEVEEMNNFRNKYWQNK